MGDVVPVPLSIVTTMYDSARYLSAFYSRSVEAASAITGDFELIFVNDGSPDDSLQVALELRHRDPRVRVIDLSRNFGHHQAIMTGLERARGNLVFLIDCDLEEDPEWLLTFRGIMSAQRCDVVYGVQERRKGPLIERIGGHIFFGLFTRVLNARIPANLVTARLMTARYVRALVRHTEREICLSGLWVITGFEQRACAITKGSRHQSSYSLRKRISALVNAITSFSNRPLVYIFQLGVGVMALAFVAAAFLVYQRLTSGIGVSGWASVMVSIWFLGGMTIFCVGIIGIYLAKVFTETKQRPYTIVRAEYGCGEDAQPG
jgi:putative glycosyltransferase